MTMWIDLREVREAGEPFKTERGFGQEDLELSDSEGRLEGRGEVTARVRLVDDLVRIDGRVSGRISLPCCRCLESVFLPVDKPFQVEYAPDPQVSGEGEELELEYEDLETGFYRGNRIDLSGLVNEQLFLDVPMKPVCRPDCLGLCPQCGTNLNDEKCGCKAESLDPRLAALAKLKERFS